MHIKSFGAIVFYDATCFAQCVASDVMIDQIHAMTIFFMDLFMEITSLFVLIPHVMESNQMNTWLSIVCFFTPVSTV